MSATATDESVVARVAAAIQEGLDDWREGRFPSPSDHDHVLDAVRVLNIDLGDEAIDRIATEIFEDAGETLVTVEDVAEYAVRRVREEAPNDPRRGWPQRGQTRIHANVNKVPFAEASSYRLTVPAQVARLVGPDRLFEVELTDDGILYRFVGGDGPRASDLPEWLR